MSLALINKSLVVVLLCLSLAFESTAQTTKLAYEQSAITYIDKSCSSCDYVVEPGDWKFDGNDVDVQPGDTICLRAGVRDGLHITNIKGTAEAPVVFMNCDGSIQCGQDASKSIGVNLIQSEHVVISGNGSTSDKYGIKVKALFGVDIQNGATDFELFAVEVLEAGYAGIAARSNPKCDGSLTRENFTQRNTHIHHCYVHDAVGGEGIYVGGSHWHSEYPGCDVEEPVLEGVRIYDNIIYNTGRDGIQVGSAISDCEIYNNYIELYGQAEDGGHMTGFMINPGTTGRLYNNIIVDGKGWGIFMQGRGDNLVYNNLIVRCSIDGVFTGNVKATEGTGFKFFNNTIVSPKDHGFQWYSNLTEKSENEIFNNIILNPGKEYHTGNTNYNAMNNLEVQTEGDLKFEDYANDVYKLLEGSSAIDQGLSIEEFEVSHDITRHSRVYGEGVDMGAYEYTEPTITSSESSLVFPPGLVNQVSSSTLELTVNGADMEGDLVAEPGDGFKISLDPEDFDSSDPINISPDYYYGLESKIYVKFIPSETGEHSYVLKLTSESAETKEITLTGFGVLVADSEEASDFVLYPNPAQNSIYLERNSSLEDDIQVLLYGMDGKLVLRNRIPKFENSIILDLRELISGMYLLKIGDEERKILKL